MSLFKTGRQLTVTTFVLCISALALSACGNHQEGRLEVAAGKTLKIRDESGVVKTFPSSRIEFSASKKLLGDYRVSVKSPSREATIKVSSKLIHSNSDFHLRAKDIHQEFDLNASTDVQLSSGPLHSWSEGCRFACGVQHVRRCQPVTRQSCQQVCTDPAAARPGAPKCENVCTNTTENVCSVVSETRYCRGVVHKQGHDTTRTETLEVNFLTPGGAESIAKATFPSRSSTSMIVTRETPCR